MPKIQANNKRWSSPFQRGANPSGPIEVPVGPGSLVPWESRPWALTLFPTTETGGEQLQGCRVLRASSSFCVAHSVLDAAEGGERGGFSLGWGGWLAHDIPFGAGSRETLQHTLPPAVPKRVGLHACRPTGPNDARVPAQTRCRGTTLPTTRWRFRKVIVGAGKGWEQLRQRPAAQNHTELVNPVLSNRRCA